MKLRYAVLLAAVALASLAFAGSASATTLTSPTGTTYTGSIHAENESTHVTLDSPVGAIACHSTVQGNVESHGAGVTAKGNITVTFTQCTEGWHVTVIASGSLEIHWLEEHVGTVTWTGATITTTVGGIACNYATNATDIGRLTDSHKTGNTATLDIEAKLPIHSGSSIFCGTQATTWTGSYIVTTPDKLYVDP